MWKDLPIILILVLSSLVIFNILKKYFLSKVKMNKFYILIAILLITALPLIFYKSFYKISGLYYIQTILLSILVLMFMEVRKQEKEQKNKPVIGRPKPNPRRLKNIK